MLVRVRHPRADVRALQREVDRIFRTAVPLPRSAAVPVAVTREADGLSIRVELPGVDPAAMAVEVDQGILVISADRRAETRAEGRYHVRERQAGTFRYAVRLPADCDAGAVRAEANQGVLTVRVPVSAAAVPRTIPVTVD